MRSFDERKAEVLRRGNMRIKAKKRRRTVLVASAVPSAFCVLIMAAYLGIVMRPAGSDMNEEKYNDHDMMADVQDIDRISVSSSDGYYKLYSDASSIEDIKFAITEIIGTPCGTKNEIDTEGALEEDAPVDGNAPLDTESPVDDGDKNNGNEKTEEPKKDTICFCVTIVDVAENSSVYEIRGNILIDIYNGYEYLISDGELVGLKETLGVS